jgi:Flp pilus assembly pilin Flp
MNTDTIQALYRDQQGITALEYAIFAGLIALAICAASPLISGLYTSGFNQMATQAASTLANLFQGS